jgi:hypothetical protein
MGASCPRGNPRLTNLSSVLRELTRTEAVHFKAETNARDARAKIEKS